MDAAVENRIPSIFTVPIMLFIVALFLFAALLTGQTMLTVFCLLVLVTVAVARVWSRMSPARVVCRTRVDKRRLFPGEVLDVAVDIQNNKFLPVWVGLGLEPGECLRFDENNRTVTCSNGLLWYQRVRFGLKMTAVRRGVQQIGPLAMEVGDLPGFFPRRQKTADPQEIIVYPRLTPLNPVSLARRDFFGIPGARSPIEDPVYVHGIRDYQYRRPARFIHWKASARYHRLQEKVCEPAQQEKVLLMVRTDHFAQDPEGTAMERCLEAVASMAVDFDRRRIAVGLVSNGRLVGDGRAVVPVSRSRNQLAQLLETLARLQANPQRGLLDVLQQGGLPWGVTCILFVYGHDAGRRALNQYLKQRHVPFLTIECDPAAAPADDDGGGSPHICRLGDLRADTGEGA